MNFAERQQHPAIAGASIWVFGAAIILYPIVAIFAPNAFVILLVATSLALLLDGRNRTGVLTALPRVPAVFIAGLAAWSLIAVSWSPDPLNGIALWGRVAGGALCGLLLFASARKLTRFERDTLNASFAVAGVVFVILFGFEFVTVGRLSGALITLWNDFTPWQTGLPRASILLTRASAALAIMSWLCALAICRRYSVRWAGLFLAVVLVNLLVQSMLASLVAFLSAAAVFAIVYRNSRWGVITLLVGLFVINLALAATAIEIVRLDREGALSFDIMVSWKERLYILEFVQHRIVEQPLFGWGFDASRAIGQDTPSGFGGDMAIPLHPHNLWAQVWLELGFIGVVLSAGAVAVILSRVAALGVGRGTIATAVAVATAYLLIGNISFGMWQSWWLSVAWLCAGFLAVLVDPPSDSSQPPSDVTVD